MKKTMTNQFSTIFQKIFKLLDLKKYEKNKNKK